MARIDKLNRSSFRAPLAADWGAGDVGDVVGVGLNASGQVVKGAGATGIEGVVCITEVMVAGDIVDVLQDGSEIADFNTLADGSTATTVGTRYYAATANGAVSTTNTGAPIGVTLVTNGSRRLRVKIERPAA